jgi:hypothetical protein
MPHPKEDRNPLGFGNKMKVGLLYTPSAMGRLYDHLKDWLFLSD